MPPSGAAVKGLMVLVGFNADLGWRREYVGCLATARRVAFNTEVAEVKGGHKEEALCCAQMESSVQGLEAGPFLYFKPSRDSYEESISSMP